MDVPFMKSGHDHPTPKVDDVGLGADEAPSALVIADVDELAVIDRYGPGDVVLAIDRVDEPLLEDGVRRASVLAAPDTATGVATRGRGDQQHRGHGNPYTERGPHPGSSSRPSPGRHSGHPTTERTASIAHLSPIALKVIQDSNNEPAARAVNARSGH